MKIETPFKTYQVRLIIYFTDSQNGSFCQTLQEEDQATQS